MADALIAPIPVFPRPRVPLYPILGSSSSEPVLAPPAAAQLTAFVGPDTQLTASGRTSLARGLQFLGVTPPFSILMPAFHCVPMVQPVVEAGGNPHFYRLREDLSVDLDDCANKLTSATRALLAVHFFGFGQDMRALKDFCTTHRLMLIEDCAHAYFGSRDGVTHGATGDIAIASAWKFFPLQDGGCLISRNKRVLPSLPPRDFRYQLKSLVNAVEIARSFGRYRRVGKLVDAAISVKDRGIVAVAQRKSTEASDQPGESGGRLAEHKISLASRAILRMTDKPRTVAARRANYLKLANLLAAAPHCRPLFDHLPDDTTPYVMPMRMEEPERVFAPLKMRGVPILRFGEFRWPDMPPSTCAVSDDLSRRIFQFPCHQSLTGAELTWMAEEITAVLRGRPGARSLVGGGQR